MPPKKSKKVHNQLASIVATEAKIKKEMGGAKAKASARPKSHLARKLAGGLASTVGNMFGLGNEAKSAMDYVSDIIGFGDYKVNSNSIMTDTTQAPVFKENGDRVSIAHKEFIGTITSAVSFKSAIVSLINPNNPVLFPWLSTVAQNYEQYEFNGLVFMYKPTSGTAISSTNPAQGVVIMATEYDVSKPPFQSRFEMENYEFATSCVPYEAMLHPVECNPSMNTVNNRFTLSITRQTKAAQTLFSSTNVGSGVQAALQNVGRVQVSVDGQQGGNAALGELWVSYDISFLKPRIGTLYNAYRGFYHVTGPNSSLITANSTSIPPFFSGAVGPNYYVITDSTSTLQGVGLTSNNTLILSGIAQGTVIHVMFQAKFNSIAVANTLTIPNPFVFSSPNLTQGSLSIYTDPGANPLSGSTQVYSVATNNTVNSSVFEIVYVKSASIENDASVTFNNLTFAAGTGDQWVWDLRVTTYTALDFTNGVPSLSTSFESRIGDLESALSRSVL
jgi:hypothetical protein